MTGTKQMRERRDAVIRYLYENHANQVSFAASYEEVSKGTGISHSELQDVHRLMYNQGISGGPGEFIGGIGLSERGQIEAERIGPITSLRAQDAPQNVTIHANYSVVQVAGNNSTQTASLSIDQSHIEAVLNEIERTIPALEIDPAKKAEAAGLLTSLRDGLTAKIGDAGLRAIGGALGSILVAAGSPLGQRLMETLNIAFG